MSKYLIEIAIFLWRIALMASTNAPSFCTSPSYLTSFDIYNAINYTSLNSSQRLSTLLGGQPSNISIYPFGATSIVPENFTYGSLTLPLSKPLSIQCPVPACVFPVSGYFAFLQRLLYYVNIVLAAFVVFYYHLVRGIAQIWLTTIWFGAVILFGVNISTTGTPLIYNLDLAPALLVVHIGLLPTLIWFAFRADRRGAEELSPIPRWNWKRVRGRLSHHPLTLVALSLYGLFLVSELITARKTENSTSRSFWPIPIAVIVESDTQYLLTSACYQESSGLVGFWPPQPTSYNGIRKLSDMAVYYPPPSTTAIDALRVLPENDLFLMHALSLVLCAFMVLLSLTSLKELENYFDRPRRCVFPSSLPNNLIYASRFSLGRTAAWWIAVIPFVIAMLMAAVVEVFLVARYEQRYSSASIPTAEAMFEIGQWAPWLTETLAIVLVMVAKWLGWPFREAEKEPAWQAIEQNEEDAQGQKAGGVVSAPLPDLTP